MNEILDDTKYQKALKQFYLSGLTVSAVQFSITFQNQNEKQTAMDANEDREGFVIENDSDGNLYILAEDKIASKTKKTLTIGPGEVYESTGPLARYTGTITYFGELSEGRATVTEFSRTTR